ncbi:MAG: hypothetical protein KC643_31065 [Nitrospira sp.]|nr:hypothetical protein [Nitrospira sp.]
MRISKKTLSLLTQLIQHAFSTHNDIDLLIQEFHLQDDVQTHSVNGKALHFIKKVEDRIQQGLQGEDTIIDLIERVIIRPRLQGCPSYVASTYEHFCNSLVVDGFIITNENRLLPTSPGPASIAPQLSKLEQNLDRLGLSIARTHYQQAYKNFTDGQYEACNGQIRPFVENLIPEVCKSVTGAEFENNPPAALQNLRQNSKIDHNEEGIFKNFWSHIQDRGPHQGLTTESDALYRLHMSTAIARYLMEKLMGVT